MNKITKAIFPVAGLGTRFLPATKASPKEMLPIVDKPLIQYAVEEAISAGIDIPIILLTGKGNADIDKNAMEKGAYDYLIKSDISSESLERSIRYALTRYGSIKALQKSENKYRTMFENSKDGMFTLNEAFDIIDINNAGLEILGLSREEVTGKPSYEIVLNGDEIIKKMQDSVHP